MENKKYKVYKTVSINVRMTPEEARAYHELKDMYGVNVSAYVRRCLDKHLAELKKLEKSE